MKLPLKANIPQFVYDIMLSLNCAGFQAYIVGGCVRDLLLKKTPHDYDISCSALPEQVRRALPNFKVIDTGIKFGTVTVVTKHGGVEVTTFRSDGAYRDFRRPEQVSFSESITDDLSRRDFTINAIAYNPSEGIIDPFHGRDDLQLGIIRCVGEPDLRFCEDALRIMRALRFCSTLGFSIESCTACSIFKNAHLIKSLSAERCSAELLKLMTGAGVSDILSNFLSPLCEFIPELSRSDSSKFYSISHIRPYDYMRLAALFCTFKQDQRTSLAESALLRMKIDNRRRRKILTLCSLCGNPSISPAEIIKAHGRNFFYELMEINRVLFPAEAESWDLISLRGHEILRRDCEGLKDLAISGSDLLKLGFPQNDTLGKTLDFLLLQVMNGQLENSYQSLISAAKQLLL